MDIDFQTKLFSAKTSVIDKIINPHYIATICPYHKHHTCLSITYNKRNFHCLYDAFSRPIRYKFYNSSLSCDIPENFYDLYILNDKLGSEYVLPFVVHFRIASGETVGMFELKNPVYGPSILQYMDLAETYLTYIVLFCETSYRLGGIAPVIKNMSFLYASSHPILVDIGIMNAVRRCTSQFEEIFNQKKWKTFLTKRFSKRIIEYLKKIHPRYFKRKKKQNKICILEETINFNDITHEILCQTNKTCLYDILKKYQFYVQNLVPNIQRILDSIK